jgi:ABC-2 type transport system ATP-binding protein
MTTTTTAPAPADDQPIISVQGVSKRFVIHKDKSIKERIVNFRQSRDLRDDFWALRDVSLDIPAGQTVGLMGHNGSGKSTLLKAIGGIIHPTSGTVMRRGRMAALLELGAGFHPDLTGRENVFLNASILGLSKQQTEEVFDDIVEFSGIGQFIDTQVKFYSSGMYVRLAFAVAINSDPDLLLVDEVLAVGDEPFQKKCMDKIRQFQREGRTIVVVSHSVEQVADLCDRIVVLKAGEVIHDGSVDSGVRALRGAFEEDRVAELPPEELDEAGQPLPAVTIDDVVVTVDGRPNDGVIEPGAALEIVATCTVHDYGPWIAGLSIATPPGHLVYRVNSQGFDAPLPDEPGTYDLVFSLRDVSLGGGQYVVKFGAERPAGARLDLNESAAIIEFARDPHGAGDVQFSGGFRVDRTDARSLPPGGRLR